MPDATEAKTDAFYRPVGKELAQVRSNLHNLVKGKGDHLDDLLGYLFDRGGKGMRPAITLLTSKVHGTDESAEAPAAAVVMATAVELLHIATLIHDDTVDNSTLRRGRETISNRWDQNVAILLGDYVFATSATFVCDTESVRVIRRFSETIMDLSSGQLMEYFNSGRAEQDRSLYEERIYRKTASLFQTAAETGAILGGSPEETVAALSQYGYNVGMGFQIVDDILDVEGDMEEIGKPVGNDLAQGVLTLPTIMLMERSEGENPIRRLFAHPEEPEHLGEALRMIQGSSIVEECYAEAEGYCEKARQAISGLPDSPSLRALELLAGYVTERRK